MPDDPNAKKVLAELKRCMRAARGDRANMATCETAFKTATGTTVTADGGKVFSIVDGGEAFATTGGKVF